MKESKPETQWDKSVGSNLVLYVPSGTYFARVRIGGKLIRRSLKTDVASVAKIRLADFVRDRLKDMDGETRAVKGKMLFADALKAYENRLTADTSITEGAKVYRRKCIKALLASWPTLTKTNVAKISKTDCVTWAAKFSAEYSASVYNNTVGTLRGVLEIAIKSGARYGNPASEITKRKVKSKELTLPSHAEFEKLVSSVSTAGGRFSRDCAYLIRFLAFGGFRKTEASHVTWADCDFTRGQIHLRITKNGHARFVPMIPEMRTLLERLRDEGEDKLATEPVMAVKECQKAMDSAVKSIEIARITHHDLRHLFATRCIESGVDIPTVSRWLGHLDGGALAMKVYGHLRDQHSTEMAQRVSFLQPATRNRF